MKNYRECGGVAKFNSGHSKCVFDPGKVKMLILVEHGYGLGNEVTAEKLKELCHAARPDRLYPAKTVQQYAPSGGEGQTSTTGYGPTIYTGLSAKTDTYTLEENDFGLRANLIKIKNTPMDMFVVDNQNAIYGMDNNDGEFVGIPLSVVYPGGQEFDTESTPGNLTVTVGYKDVEAYYANASFIQCDFDVMSAMDGLVFVEFVKDGDVYRLIEHYGGLNVTGYFGALLAKNVAAVMDGGVTAIEYSAESNTLKITGDNPSLKAPSVLFANGIYGIEQWTTSQSSISGGGNSGGQQNEPSGGGIEGI